MPINNIEFGWFLPTMGDESEIGNPAAFTPQDPGMLIDIAKAAEESGFEYILIPVGNPCWDAYAVASTVAAHTTTLKPLVAARGGFIAPTVMAKMLSTMDQLTGGRILVNLITGGDPAEMKSDGQYLDHDERYDVLSEAVDVMRKSWVADEPFDYEGKYFNAEGIHIRPKPVGNRTLPLYLGGLSESAKELCATHADVHLFWGDTPENIGVIIEEMRARAATKERTLKFGMRLQVIVRETEDEAWEAAHDLISHASSQFQEQTAQTWRDSEANRRMHELAQIKDNRLDDHLWSGIAKVRRGAGVAIVGNPEQVAKKIQEFIEVGCSSFCLSGYPHAEEARRFSELVMPLIKNPVDGLSNKVLTHANEN